MYKKIEKCPVCDSIGSFTNKFICKDFLVSQESFALVECKECKLILTNPRPTDAELGKFYNSEEYSSHQLNKKRLQDILYGIIKSFNLRRKWKLINRLYNTIENPTKEKTILDVGCGMGDFLLMGKKKGWKVAGVEPNEKGKKETEKKINSEIKISTQDIDNQHFSIITAWHALEHIPDLNETVKKWSELLIKNGILVLALPNHLSYDAEYYQEYWAGYDVPRHLYHFQKESVKKLLKKHKLKLITTYPLLFDAYYVSLLSEKYKNGKTNYMQSLKIGRRSNQWAKKNDGNYSSLIYIAQK